MKKKDQKILVKVLAALGLLALTATIVYAVKSYFPKVSFSNPINDDGIVRILAVGSSSTASEYSYLDQLVETYPEINDFKVAEVGATTTWMLQNAEPEITTGAIYDAVIIFGGLNDIYATLSIDAAKQNIQEIVDLAAQRGSITVVLTLQPTHEYASYTDQKGSLTISLNEWIKTSCKCDYVIDVYSMLLSGGVQNTDYFEPDNLHLNYDAHSLIAAEIDSKIFI